MAPQPNRHDGVSLIAVVPAIGWVTQIQRPLLAIAGLLLGLAVLLELRKGVGSRATRSQPQSHPDRAWVVRLGPSVPLGGTDLTLRKTAALLATIGIMAGFIGSGVGASFFDSVTASENISVGTFECLIVSPSDGVIAGDGKSLSYDAPEITSSAPGSRPSPSPAEQRHITQC